MLLTNSVMSMPVPQMPIFLPDESRRTTLIHTLAAWITRSKSTFNAKLSTFCSAAKYHASAASPGLSVVTWTRPFADFESWM